MNNKTFIITEQNVAVYAQKISDWIYEQVMQANRKGVVLGMSGGIDCSVVARLCQLAKVDICLILMPYGDDMQKTKSYDHAMDLINKFGISYQVFDIKPIVDTMSIEKKNLPFEYYSENLTLSYTNLRPRIRMVYLYQLAQLGNRFVIGTGNLAERTVGYFTKWGDGACDLNPLAMLTKKEIYILAQYVEVPNSIIDKKPSAGLWDGQTDEEDLGMSYDQIDNYILNGTSKNELVDSLIQKRIALSAHKFDKTPIFEG